MSERSYPLGMKKVSDSRTEITRIIIHEDINGQNRLFGGRLMEWIDEAAGIAAMRHCGGNVTTCSVDSLVFKKGAYLNDVLVMIARVTYVGNTSLEVRVDTFIEDLTDGRRTLINHAYLTEVLVDKEGRPQPIPYGLEPETDTEKMLWEGAIRRKQIRKERREEGF